MAADWITAALPQLVTLAVRSGVNAHGDPLYAAQQQLDARVEQRAQLVRGERGEALQSSTSVRLAVPVAAGDRIWLASEGAAGAQNPGRTIMAVTAIPDLEGEIASWVAYL